MFIKFGELEAALYVKDTLQIVVLTDGTACDAKDDRFRKAPLSESFSYPDGSELRFVLMCRWYHSLSDYLDRHLGYRKDPETGLYGYYTDG